MLDIYTGKPGTFPREERLRSQISTASPAETQPALGPEQYVHATRPCLQLGGSRASRAWVSWGLSGQRPVQPQTVLKVCPGCIDAVTSTLRLLYPSRNRRKERGTGDKRVNLRKTELSYLLWPVGCMDTLPSVIVFVSC